MIPARGPQTEPERESEKDIERERERAREGERVGSSSSSSSCSSSSRTVAVSVAVAVVVAVEGNQLIEVIELIAHSRFEALHWVNKPWGRRNLKPSFGPRGFAGRNSPTMPRVVQK